MKKTILRGILIALLAPLGVWAQDDLYYHNHRTNNQTASTGFSGTGANLNVVYQRLQWAVNPNDATKNITGTITTYFTTTQPNVTAISFDLNKNAFNNGSLAVTWHGISCATSFPSSGLVNILNITLPTTIVATGTLDSVVINYSGTPPARSGAAEGFQRGTYNDQSGVTQFYTNTLSESYEDRDWWPCKADMQDKVDSMDIEVTVPWSGADTFWVATNGKLMDSAIDGSSRLFKFKTRYPIASYLVCLNVGKYNRYYRSVNVNGTEVPVVYNLLRGKTTTYYNNALTAMDRINAVLVAFSNKFGDYPFKLEKHGFYDGLLGASGMEHQTFSGMSTSSITSLSTLSHELMHQWFGDNVTFGTWNDLWLAEGFARYSESLAGELVPSLGLNTHNQRTSLRTSALNLGAQSAWIPNSNIATSATIWSTNYGSTVYNRGAMIVSMLRAISGDDKFYEALRNYQTALAGKSASGDSLKRHFNTVLGADISNFFNDYVGGSGNAATTVGGIGHPTNNMIWNSPEPNKLVVRVGSQTTSASSNVAYYNGPVVLHVTGFTPSVEDTTIVLYDWGGGTLSTAGRGLGTPISGNLLSYNLSFTPFNVAYDDSARTLSQGSTTNDFTLEGYVWYGGTSTSWTDPANWATCCGVPPNGADVTINTTTHAPLLPGAVTVRNLTINTGRLINIGNNTLTITGSVTGTGAFSGSTGSNLILTGQAGTLSFNQASAATRSLNSLTMAAGSSARLATNADVTTLTLNPTANLIVVTGVNLVTK